MDARRGKVRAFCAYFSPWVEFDPPLWFQARACILTLLLPSTGKSHQITQFLICGTEKVIQRWNQVHANYIPNYNDNNMCKRHMSVICCTNTQRKEIIHLKFKSTRMNGSAEKLQLIYDSLVPLKVSGGGGSIWTSPVRNPQLSCGRRRSRHTFWRVFSFKSYVSFDTKFAKIRPSVARSRDVLYSHVGIKIFPKSVFCICLCTKHMEITDCLKIH